MLPLQRRFDLGYRRYALRNFDPPVMRVADDIRRSVIFIGHGAGNSFKSCGTAFLLAHKARGFLVTANHIAHLLGDDPFAFRFNSPTGSHTIQFDPLSEGAEALPWLTHDDPNVDVAVMPFHFNLPAMGGVSIWLSDDMPVTEKIRAEESIGCGNACYAVGLFRLLQGGKRNLPVIHTGNIALMPSKEDLIPTEDWRNPKSVIQIEGYLVEMTNLEGLSGAPVFVRPEIEIVDVPVGETGAELTSLQVARTRLYLIGVWQGSWTAPYDAKVGRYPLGMGVVTPIERVTEILDTPRAAEAIKRFDEIVAQRRAAKGDFDTPTPVIPTGTMR